MTTHVYLYGGCIHPATSKSYGYDLAVNQDVTAPPGEVVVAPTGLRLGAELPKRRGTQQGLAMLILPRSSLTLKWGLIIPNSPGLIDADYAGEIGVLLYNLRSTPVTVPVDTRVAQVLFVWVEQPFVAESDLPIDATRGGFGSTGL